MSGERPAAVLLVLLMLSWQGPAAADPGRSSAAGMARSSPQTPGARAPLLREPQAVHGRLRTICEQAGYPQRHYRSCAAAISQACRNARLPANSPRCWQWLVDRDATGLLDRNSLRRGAGPAERKGLAPAP